LNINEKVAEIEQEEPPREIESPVSKEENTQDLTPELGEMANVADVLNAQTDNHKNVENRLLVQIQELTKVIQKQEGERANNTFHTTALLTKREYLIGEQKRTHVNEADGSMDTKHEEKEKAKGTVEFLVENEINEIEVGEEGSKKDELKQIIIQTEELTQEIRDEPQQKQIGITEQLFQILGLKPVQSTPVLDI
ncbi:13202_t:CDS:2, partial [Ambispora gerdemannii]